MSSSVNEISVDVSRRMCTHMNEDHAASVYAMTLAILPSSDRSAKLSNAKLTEITLSSYKLTYRLCKGDVCQMRDATVSFNPPLTSQKDARPRLIEEHNKALMPRVSWLITESYSPVIVVMMVLLTYGTIFLGEETLVSELNQSTVAASTISSLFGSTETFAYLVKISFYFAVIAHVFESAYVVYLCKATLKMSTVPMLLWFLLTNCVGFPIASKIMTLASVHDKAKSKKNESKKV